MFFSRPAGNKYKVKADQESYDFDQIDFTYDNDYHDLDLSGIIDKGSILVHIWFWAKSSLADKHIFFTKKGYSGTYLKMDFSSQIDDKWIGGDIWIPVGADRNISYKIPDITWDFIRLNVIGWFI